MKLIELGIEIWHAGGYVGLYVGLVKLG